MQDQATRRKGTAALAPCVPHCRSPAPNGRPHESSLSFGLPCVRCLGGLLQQCRSRLQGSSNDGLQVGRDWPPSQIWCWQVVMATGFQCDAAGRLGFESLNCLPTSNPCPRRLQASARQGCAPEGSSARVMCCRPVIAREWAMS